MKKKVYITPAVNIHILDMKDGFMLPLSGEGTDNGAIMESKGSGDWDIWGDSSDSDDDDFDY